MSREFWKRWGNWFKDMPRLGSVATSADEARERKFSLSGDRWERHFLSLWFVSITTVLGVISGFLGAAWEKAITASIGQCLAWCGAERLAALFADGAVVPVEHAVFRFIVFGVFVLLFGLSFGSTLWAQTRALDHSSSRLESHNKALDKAVGQLGFAVARLETLPPDGFLLTYDQTLPVILNPWFREGERRAGSYDAETYKQLVMSQLTAILVIARAFVEQPNARMGCDIMYFRTCAGLSQDEQDRLQGQLQFAEADAHISQMFGCLESIKDLSAAVDGDGSFECPDSKHLNCVLPVPNPGNLGIPPERTLPGAPLAVLKKAPTFIAGPKDREVFAAKASVSSELRDRWQRWFDENPHLVSFMSFPILSRESRNVVGVLNLYLDCVDDKAGEKIRLLSPLMSPVIGSLDVLLKLHFRP